MARPKKKPEYDSDQVAQQIMEAVTDAYLNPPQGTEDDTGHMQLKQLAEEFSMTPLKVRKLLVVNDKLNGSTGQSQILCKVHFGCE